MARRSSLLGDLMTLGVVGLFGYAMFTVAKQQPPSSPLRQAAEALEAPFRGRPAPSGSSAPAQRGETWLNLQHLCDLDHFCALQVNPGANQIRQMPELGGTNTYGVFAIFRDHDSDRLLQYLGGLEFLDLQTGEQFTWGQRGN